MDTFEDFKKYFTYKKSGNFWSTVETGGLLPFANKVDKDIVLETVYNQLTSKSYQPSQPRGYIIVNKGNYIARVIPVLTPEDICVYYYCVKKVETDIVGNRVSGTYGGWSLGGPIRKEEELEKNYIIDNLHQYKMPDGQIFGVDTSGEYSKSASFNPNAWRKHWKDFTRTLYINSRSDTYDSIAELDIANFYDNINVDIFEKKIENNTCDKEYKELLITFLKKWGGYSNNMTTSYKGVPQDEIGDCSRLIANYYLQEYDLEMNALCEQYDAKYFRYADDQIIFSHNDDELKEIIARASLLILHHGLCFNKGKTKILKKVEFEKYFSFEWFIKYGEKNMKVTKDVLKDELTYYTKNKTSLKNNGVSVLLRLLTLAPNDLYIDSLLILQDSIINYDFLSSSKFDVWQLDSLFSIMNEDQKVLLVDNLNNFSKKIIYNQYHYIVLKFFKLHKIDTHEIENRLELINSIFKIPEF